MNPPNLSDLISEKLLEPPVPIDAHWDAFERYIKVCLPSAVVGFLALAFALVCVRVGWHDVAWAFGGLGLVSLSIIIYGVFVYEDDRKNKEWRRNLHERQLTIVGVAINNLTIIHKAHTVNIGNVPAQPRQQMLVPEVDAEINNTYEVALVMLHEALGAWNANHQKRPRIKPFSFDATAKLIEVGHPRWQDACTMLEDANILQNALVANWEVLVTDEKTAIQHLDILLNSRGYYSHLKDGRREWRKAVPQLGTGTAQT